MSDDTRYSRRALLGAAGAGAAAVVVGCSGDDGAAPRATVDVRERPDPGSSRRVIVVGAGLAGLTTATALTDAGWDVVVLEARDRVGGRVHTLREPFSDGLHAEGGGESIDTDHTAIQALIARFGLRTEPRPVDKITTAQVFRGGRRQPISDFAGEPVLADYGRFDEALARLATGLDPDRPESFGRAEELDLRSLASLVDELGLRPEARFLVETEQRGAYNAELDQVSLLFAAQQAVISEDAPVDASEALRIAGGNSLLPEAMRTALGDRVVTGAAVSEVRWDGDGVRVTTTDGTVHDGTRVVLALPAPPLRRITFQPDLPRDLATSVADLALGTAAKVSTEYARRFWNDLDSSGFTLSDQQFQVAWAATDSSGGPDDPGILTQFTTGDAALDVSCKTDARRIAALQTQLDEVYPEGRATRTDRAATVAWANEAFTGGGYAVFGPGQLTTTWPAFRAGAGDGTVLFAGEHTEALAGYMESAVRSGQRVAAQIGPART